MTPEKKREQIHDLMTTVLIMGALIFLLRLWPILLLLLLMLMGYALWALVRAQKQPVKPETAAPPLLPPPATEQTILADAFGILQRRITEQVLMRYPEARWVWSASNAFDQFASGLPLTILLNGAGGYQKAHVQVQNLQFVGLEFGSVPNDAEAPQEEAGLEQDEEPGSDEVEYGLIAFEWVEANLHRLNAQGNEAVAGGKHMFRIPAEELPHGDGWPDICAELVRSGFAAAEAVADGIKVTIKTE